MKATRTEAVHWITSTLMFIMILALWCPQTGCASRDRDPVAPPARTLTVMTYNIHHGEGMDGRLDLARIADVIRDSGAELVSLQEVDRMTERSGGVDQIAELGRMTGMYHAFGSAIEFQGGQYGVGVLSSYPIDKITNLPLSHTEGYEARTALAIDVVPWEQDPIPVRFIATHWQHNLEDDRVVQAHDVDRRFGRDRVQPTRRLTSMVVLAGDLNAEPGDEPLKTLRRRWRFVSRDTGTDAALLTWPADEPTVSIDHVYVSPPNVPLYPWQVEVVNERVASDHRPVVVVLEVDR